MFTDTATSGSGTIGTIIDAFSDSEYTGGDVTLWHTISVWQGDYPPTVTPYGVYSGSEGIPW